MNTVPLRYCSCCDAPLLPNGNCPSPCANCTGAPATLPDEAPQ